MKLYDAPDAERKAVFIEAAAELGIRQDMVEKDFWVSWVLNRMFGDRQMARIFLFKGGLLFPRRSNASGAFPKISTCCSLCRKSALPENLSAGSVPAMPSTHSSRKSANAPPGI